MRLPPYWYEPRALYFLDLLGAELSETSQALKVSRCWCSSRAVQLRFPAFFTFEIPIPLYLTSLLDLGMLFFEAYFLFPTPTLATKVPPEDVSHLFNFTYPRMSIFVAVQVNVCLFRMSTLCEF
jgi:hypothetical protein